ncbi:hypothetical protein AB0A69_27475 [Streptomyces sp. NPDC045431]|uniref:hypothetical protein n=1 Tax=Streptomyces sp. NPDC045431 TaxID=3155613 RepID=UPI0034067AC7
MTGVPRNHIERIVHDDQEHEVKLGVWISNQRAPRQAAGRPPRGPHRARSDLRQLRMRRFGRLYSRGGRRLPCMSTARRLGSGPTTAMDATSKPARAASAPTRHRFADVGAVGPVPSPRPTAPVHVPVQ